MKKWSGGIVGLLICSVVLATIVSAHSPYSQWYRFRQQYFYMGIDAGNPTVRRLGNALESVMRTHLPRSRAMTVHGKSPLHIGKLLESNQLFASLFHIDHARALYRGEKPFHRLGPVKVQAMTDFDTYVLVAHPKMPDRKAYLVARTLSRHWDGLKGEENVIPDRPRFDADTSPLPFHPGAADFYRGRPLPPAGHSHVPWLSDP